MLRHFTNRASSAILLERLHSALDAANIHASPLVHERASQPLIFRRYYSSSPHEDHKNDHGLIKRSIIKTRKRFLNNQGMLRNVDEFEGKKVYQNKHLYKLTRENRRRLAQGKAPLCDKGEPITLHHLDQTHASDWVALRLKFHQKHHHELHSQTTVDGAVHRKIFARERQRYWKSRLANRH